MQRSFVFRARPVTLILITCIGFPIGGRSQGPAPAAPTAMRAANVKDSVDDLDAKVRDLRTALAEMHAELVASRREAQELRQTISAAAKEMAAIRREFTEPGHKIVMPIAAQFSETPANAESSQAAKPLLDQPLKRLGDELATLSENEQLLTAKVTDEYQTKVDSGSKYRLRLSGLALFGMSGTRGSVDNVDLPNIAEARHPMDSSGTFGATLRQSSLSLEVFGPAVGSAKTGGDIQFDFFGGFPNTDNGVTSGLVRLRTARIRLDWPHTSIVVGQDAPFFSPLSPTSLASTATPAFSYSGNIWTWTPQIRFERRVALAENSSLLLQVGILDPLTGESPGYGYYRLPSAGERSRQPAYAARFAWTGSAWGRPLTLGSGAYFSRQDWGFGRTVNAWAATADWELPLGRRFSLSGEFYRGISLGGFGAGASGRVLFNGPPEIPSSSALALESAGGWSQVTFTPMDKIEFNGAFGEDYPFRYYARRFSVIPYSAEPPLGRNATAFVNVIYHARSNLVFSVEYRRLWTSEIIGPRQTADHVNASAGILF